MLDVIANRDDPRLVPLAGRADDAARCGIETVVRAGGRQRIQPVGMAGVVDDLHFGGAQEDPFVPFFRAVEDAAAAAGGDLPLERELEIAVLRLDDQVAAGADTRERAFADGPSCGGSGPL